MTWLRCH